MNATALAAHPVRLRPDAATHWIRHLRAWGIEAHRSAAPDATALIHAAPGCRVIIHCTDPRRLLRALRTLVDPSVHTNEVPTGCSPNLLSERERTILCAVAQGYSNKEIAQALNLVEGTVKNYLSTIFAKLDARDRAHAVMLAVRAGLLHEEPVLHRLARSPAGPHRMARSGTAIRSCRTARGSPGSSDVALSPT